MDKIPDWTYLLKDAAALHGGMDGRMPPKYMAINCRHNLSVCGAEIVKLLLL